MTRLLSAKYQTSSFPLYQFISTFSWLLSALAVEKSVSWSIKRSLSRHLCRSKQWKSTSNLFSQSNGTYCYVLRYTQMKATNKTIFNNDTAVNVWRQTLNVESNYSFVKLRLYIVTEWRLLFQENEHSRELKNCSFNQLSDVHFWDRFRHDGKNSVFHINRRYLTFGFLFVF